MKNLFFLLTGLFVISFCSAQSLQNSLDEQDWTIITGISQVAITSLSNPSEKYYGDFNTARVAVSPTETALAVSYDKTNFGIICVNDQLKIEWNTPLTGIPVAIGKFHDKILVIVSTRLIGNESIENEFDGILLDPATGKAGIAKNIFVKDVDYTTEPMFLFNKKTSDFKLGLRAVLKGTEKQKQLFGVGSYKSMGDDKDGSLTRSKSCKIVSFNSDLSVAGNYDLPIKKDLRLVQYSVNENGEIVLAYYDGGTNITVQKIDADGKTEIAISQFTFNEKYKDDLTIKLFPSRVNNAVAYVSVDYKDENKDKAMLVYRVDLSAKGEPSFFKTEVNKAFKKSAESTELPLGKRTAKVNTGYWDNMDVEDIQDDNDKVIIYKEVSTTISPMQGSGNSQDYSGDASVSICNKQMQLLAEVVLPKKIITFSDLSISSSLFIHNHILSFMASTSIEKDGDGLYAEIDLNTNKLVKYELLERGDMPHKDALIFPKSTVWFQDGFITTYVEGNFIRMNNINSYPRKFNF